MATTLASVDLGASSGRVIVGSFEGGRVTIAETGRFANGPVSVQERTVRFLKNILGLWILNECVRAWKDGGIETSVAQLVTEAADVPMLRTVVDVNDPAFLHSGDMAGWITDLARESGQPLLGSLLVQARTVGAIHGGLPAMRQVVRASCPTVRYEPDAAHCTVWDAAEKRVLG
jgi:hypothetical protein